MGCALYVLRHLCGRSGRPFPGRDAQCLSLQRPVYSQGATRERRSGCICRYHASGIRPVSSCRLSFNYHIDAELCRCQLTGARNKIDAGISVEITLHDMLLTMTTNRSRALHNGTPFTNEPCLALRKPTHSWYSRGRSF